MTRAIFHVLCLYLLSSWLPGSLSIAFDPCTPPEPVQRADPFNLGLVLMPAINASAILELSNRTGGLCSAEAQNTLAAANAKIAIYQTRVDRLTVLKMPFPDIVFNMRNATPPTMAFAAFRGNLTSPPAFIASGDPNTTRGAGFVVSVALLLRFSAGNLQYLQWYNQKCNECSNDLCVRSDVASIQACATPLTQCTCQRWNDTSRNCTLDDPLFAECATSVNVAWSGDDRNQAVFRTGAQVQRLNAFSIVDLFNTARNKFFDIKNFLYENVASSWTAVNADANSQFVDFEGGLTQYQRPSPSPPPPPVPPPAPAPPSPPAPTAPPASPAAATSPPPPPPPSSPAGEVPAEVPADAGGAPADGGEVPVDGGTTDPAVEETPVDAGGEAAAPTEEVPAT